MLIKIVLLHPIPITITFTKSYLTERVTFSQVKSFQNNYDLHLII